MASVERSSVVIIGGGIGGLAAAIGLRRAGVEATVFEKASDLRKVQVGGGLFLWNNGMRALGELGMAERVQAVGSRSIERFELRSWRDKLLVKWPVGDVGREVGMPAMGIVRSNLHLALAETLEKAAEKALVLSADCKTITPDETGVRVQFADGREVRGDVLIGADGIRSAIRTQLGDTTQIRYAGYTLWHGILDFDHDVTRDGMFLEFWGRGMRFISYPVAPGRLYWDAVTNAPEGGRDPEGGVKEQLLERFQGWPHPAEAILRAMDEKGIRRRDIYGSQPVKIWGQGRITLLGDAAHPMTFNLGQGACQALEDAVALAKRLGEKGDPVAALRAYEAKRRGRAGEIVKRAWNIGASGTWTNPVACFVRDTSMKMADPMIFKKHRSDMAHPL